MEQTRGIRTLVEKPDTDPTETMSAALSRGDKEQAYRQLVEVSKDSLYRFLRYLLRDEEAAREVFQDTYVRAFEGLEGFRGQASPTTWVITIARNLAFNRLRKKKTRERWIQPLEAGVEPAGREDSPISSPTLTRAVAELPLAQQEAVLLFYCEDLPITEVARITGRPMNTIKSDLWRARQHLRRTVEREP